MDIKPVCVEGDDFDIAFPSSHFTPFYAFCDPPPQPL
jgi:hypothetical protein